MVDPARYVGQGYAAAYTADNPHVSRHPEEAPSTMAIGGHPIHPMLVPLPIGAFLGAWVADLMYEQTNDRFWERAGRTLLGAGIVTGVAAGAVGAVDYATIKRANTLWKGRAHALGNVLALALAAYNLAGRIGRPRLSRQTRLGLSTVNAVLLTITALLGGELSYRHLIGVQSDPMHYGEYSEGGRR